MKTLKILCYVVATIITFGHYCFASIPWYAESPMFSVQADVQGVHFSKDKSSSGKEQTFAKTRITPKLEIKASDKARIVVSADIRTQVPKQEVYEQGAVSRRSDGKKSAILLQEAYVDVDNGPVNLKQGRFKPTFHNEIKFDFTKLSPFAQLDSSEPFLSLDDDRLLGSWGAMIGYGQGDIGLEVMGFLHEDPILATHADDPWTRPLPYEMDYGSFKSGCPIDWGARLSGQGWELSFFRGSSNSPNHIEAGKPGELDLVFPNQTTLEGAAEVPLGPLNFRAGVSHSWRDWKGKNAGQFLSGISEVEFLKEGAFRPGDNLLLEAGFANVWNTADSELFQDNLGIDQIYRGGSLLFTAEYSPVEDWVLKLRSIWNVGNGSSYTSPEIRRIFPTDRGSVEMYVRGMIIDGNSDSDDVISSFRDNDNVELGIRINF